MKMHPTDKPKIYHGITGNYYIISKSIDPLMEICRYIDKSVNSIGYSKKYECYVLHIKRKLHKELLRAYMRR